MRATEARHKHWNAASRAPVRSREGSERGLYESLTDDRAIPVARDARSIAMALPAYSLSAGTYPTKAAFDE